MEAHCENDGRLAAGTSVSKLKIAFVIPYFYPAWQYGGQPRSAYELARGLVQNGHCVKVVTTDSAGTDRVFKGSETERRDIDGVETVYYRNISNYLAYHHRLFCPIEFFRHVQDELRGFDIVHIHELRSTLTVPAYKAANRLGLPYVLSPHGGLRRLGKSMIKYAYDGVWGKHVLEHAAVLFAISPAEQNEAERFGVSAERINCIPNAIDLSAYTVLPAAGEFRSRWNITADNILLFVGRLHWIKGADLLVRAFAKIHRLRSDVHLVLAGPDDGQEPELRRLIQAMRLQNNVTLTGFLDEKAKRLAYADSQLLIVPSRSEVFAITALEGLLCGTPVLLSSACGLYPLPAAGICTFESESVDALLLQIQKMMSYKQTCRDVGAWREFVSRHFSVRSVASKAEMAYESVLVTV
jgi:glycosyltransferase involved in cell wall biosynthesis